MRSLITKVAVIATAFVLPTLAHADMFTLTTASSTITFSLPSRPTTNLTSGSNYFYITDVTYFTSYNSGGGTSSTGTFFFNNSGDAAFQDSTTGSFPYNKHTTDGLMYTGGTATPEFTLGTYNLTYDLSFGTTAGTPSTLNIALDPAPEPSSLLLLGTGLIGTVAATRRRFNI